MSMLATQLYLPQMNIKVNVEHKIACIHIWKTCAPTGARLCSNMQDRRCVRTRSAADTAVSGSASFPRNTLQAATAPTIRGKRKFPEILFIRVIAVIICWGARQEERWRF